MVNFDSYIASRIARERTEKNSSVVEPIEVKRRSDQCLKTDELGILRVAGLLERNEVGKQWAKCLVRRALRELRRLPHERENRKPRRQHVGVGAQHSKH